jgi:hypothetical protein
MLLLAIPAAPAAGQDNPDLTGRWVLKPEAPAGADSAGAPADSGQMVADSAAAARPSSDLRPVLRPRAKPEDQQQLSRLVGMAQPVAAFRITHEKAAVTFENDDGFTYVVRPGADWDSIQVGEEYTRVRARWRERALEIEFRPPGGGRIIETYHLADSRTYLRLEVVVEHEVLAQRLWRPRMYRRDAR